MDTDIGKGEWYRKLKPISTRRNFRNRRNFLFITWTLLFAYYNVNAESTDATHESVITSSLRPIEESRIEFNASSKSADESPASKYGKWEAPGINCTPPGIDDFPPDLFTQQQRQNGWVIVHFLVSLYIFYGLAIVCDDYFVPSIERICEELKMPSDIAGATLMAIGTSAPELFTNIIGTFITHGDAGIGTILGSAVFNILAVAAVCGLGAGMVVPLEWWSVTRDCICYLITVILLLFLLRDEKIYWYEGLTLVLVYILYILVMYKNSTLKKAAEKLVAKVQKRFRKSSIDDTEYPVKVGDSSPGETPMNGYHNENRDQGPDMKAIRDEMLIESAVKQSQDAAEDGKDETGLFQLPWDEGFKAWVECFVSWPIRCVFTITIPDCRVRRWRSWYAMTFAMCIVWIGATVWLVNWTMTIIGHTLKIPDSVMGLTLIAAGTSVPEVVSSVIVARQGLGTMAVSNSIGSNTFDILMCLGIPWLIRASLIANDEVEDYVQINSTGLEYSTLMLITSLVVLYLILAFNNFKLDRKVGFLALTLYAGFLIMASLLELNVFFTVNLPTCQYHED